MLEAIRHAFWKACSYSWIRGTAYLVLSLGVYGLLKAVLGEVAHGGFAMAVVVNVVCWLLDETFAPSIKGKAKTKTAVCGIKYRDAFGLRVGAYLCQIVGHAPLRIGRGVDNDICLPGSKVSRTHCEVFCLKGKAFVRDLGSLYGTFLNGKLVPRDGRRRLRDGDVLSLGGEHVNDQVLVSCF